MVSMEPILYDNAQCILSTFLDITERKRAENALQESEERFSKVFHLSPMAISVLSIERPSIKSEV